MDLNILLANASMMNSTVNRIKGQNVITITSSNITPKHLQIYKYNLTNNTEFTFKNTNKTLLFRLYLTMPQTIYQVNFPNNIIWGKQASFEDTNTLYMFAFEWNPQINKWLGNLMWKSAYTNGSISSDSSISSNNSISSNSSESLSSNSHNVMLDQVFLKLKDNNYNYKVFITASSENYYIRSNGNFDYYYYIGASSVCQPQGESVHSNGTLFGFSGSSNDFVFSETTKDLQGEWSTTTRNAGYAGIVKDPAGYDIFIYTGDDDRFVLNERGVSIRFPVRSGATGIDEDGNQYIMIPRSLSINQIWDGGGYNASISISVVKELKTPSNS